jgi:hypothetical protein
MTSLNLVTLDDVAINGRISGPCSCSSWHRAWHKRWTPETLIAVLKRREFEKKRRERTDDADDYCVWQIVLKDGDGVEWRYFWYRDAALKAASLSTSSRGYESLM